MSTWDVIRLVIWLVYLSLSTFSLSGTKLQGKHRLSIDDNQPQRKVDYSTDETGKKINALSTSFCSCLGQLLQYQAAPRGPARFPWSHVFCFSSGMFWHRSWRRWEMYFGVVCSDAFIGCSCVGCSCVLWASVCLSDCEKEREREIGRASWMERDDISVEQL